MNSFFNLIFNENFVAQFFFWIFTSLSVYLGNFFSRTYKDSFSIKKLIESINDIQKNISEIKDSFVTKDIFYLEIRHGNDINNQKIETIRAELNGIINIVKLLQKDIIEK